MTAMTTEMPPCATMRTEDARSMNDERSSTCSRRQDMEAPEGLGATRGVCTKEKDTW